MTQERWKSVSRYDVKLIWIDIEKQQKLRIQWKFIFYQTVNINLILLKIAHVYRWKKNIFQLKQCCANLVSSNVNFIKNSEGLIWPLNLCAQFHSHFDWKCLNQTVHETPQMPNFSTSELIFLNILYIFIYFLKLLKPLISGKRGACFISDFSENLRWQKLQNL